MNYYRYYLITITDGSLKFSTIYDNSVSNIFLML